MDNTQIIIIAGVAFSAGAGLALTTKAILADRKRRATFKREQPEVKSWTKQKGWVLEQDTSSPDVWSIYANSWIIQYDWRRGGMTFQALTAGPEWLIAPSKEPPLGDAFKEIWEAKQRAVAIAALQDTHIIASVNSIADEDAGITSALKETIGQGQNPKHLRVWRAKDTFFMVLREATPTLANLQWFEKLGAIWTGALQPAPKLAD